MTLRARLALFIALAIALALLTQGLLGYLSFQRLLLSNLDRDLEGYMGRIIRTLNNTEDHPERPGHDDRRNPFEGYVARARLIQNNQTVQNWGDFPTEVNLTQTGVNTFGNWRAARVSLGSGVFLEGAIQSQQVGSSLANYRQTVFITALLVSLLGALAAWFLSEPALRPLRHLLKTTQQIADSTDLSLRVPASGGGELGQLSTTFNHMMERLAAFLQRETQFTRNASHELRTPLTAMRLQLSSLKEGYVTAEETLQAIEEEVERMTHLTESLLTLAREGRSQPVRFDLGLVGKEVAEKYGAKFIGEPLEVSGDPILLRQAIVNLVINARKHAPKSAIEIVLKKQDDFALLTVQDYGPGMTPEAMQRATEAFYRAPGTRAPGSGLGLSVVEQVAEVHGGRLELSPNQPSGLRATLWIKKS